MQNNKNIDTQNLKERYQDTLGAKFYPKDGRAFRKKCARENKTPSEKIRELVLDDIKNDKATTIKAEVKPKSRPHYPSFTPPAYMPLNNSPEWYRNAYIGGELLGIAIWGACILFNNKGK